MSESMGGIQAIKAYIEGPSLGFTGRKVTMDEMRALSPQERAELAGMAAMALGVALDKAVTATKTA